MLERQCQRMFKLPHSCTISHASKVMLKILQARLQEYVNRELPDVQAGFRKGRGTSRVFSNTTVQKHQFFGAQLSSQFNSHIHT